MRAGDSEADLGHRDEREVRQVRAAGVRIVDGPDVAAGRAVLHHGEDRVGHRPEMDGDVLGLRDHPPPVVEQRGRAVAPLLDVRGEGGAHQQRAHLLRDRPQDGTDDLELYVYSGAQSVRVEAFAYDHAETSRGRTR